MHAHTFACVRACVCFKSIPKTHLADGASNGHWSNKQSRVMHLYIPLLVSPGPIVPDQARAGSGLGRIRPRPSGSPKRPRQNGARAVSRTGGSD